MTPEKCPGCGTKLKPEMLACPNCPMSFPEDDGPGGDSANPLKKSRYYQFVMPALFFCILGAAVWYLGMGLMRLGNANNEVENGNILGDKVTTAPHAAPTSLSAAALAAIGRPAAQGSAPDVEVPGPGGNGPDVEVPAPGGASSSHAGAASGPDAAAAADKPDGDGAGLVIISRDESAPGPGAPAPKALKEWKLRGTIYDLTTLKPLAGCAVTFFDEETNRAVKTRSDAQGRYRAIMPPLSGHGYGVAIAKGGYASNYLDPGTEGVPQMAAGQRQGLARDLATRLTATPATVEAVSEKPLVTDFYLAPRP